MLGDIDSWWQTVTSIAGEALNFIGYLFYAIFTGVGMLINFVLSLFKQLAGIEEMTLTATSTVEGQAVTKRITVGGEGNWTDITYAFITSDAVRTTFWTIFAMCIALLVVFTIFAIVKSEFSTDVKNAAKLPILERAVKSVINFLLIPVISIASLYGANMLTKAVYYTFNTDSKYYITNVMFNAGAKQANRAALDDGFANFLLTDEAVYFAEEDVVKPRDAVLAMMSNYFNITEGELTIYKYKKGAENTKGVVSTEKYPLEIDFQTTAYYGSDPYLLNQLCNNLGDYDRSESNTIAGKFGYYLKDSIWQDERKEVGYEWYEWTFQVPVVTAYINQKSGFKQIIYGIAKDEGYITTADAKQFPTLTFTVTEATIGNNDFYLSKRNDVFQKSRANTTITADDVAGWFGADGCLQACRKLSNADMEQIAAVANEYNRAIAAESNKAAAKQAVGLWEVLQYEYNTEENTIFGERPSYTDPSVQLITQEQRNCLVGFIDRLFVGSGNGGDAYRLYRVNAQDSSNSFFTTEKPAEGVDYMEISSTTLHVEKYNRKTWQGIFDDTNGWSASYTPDVQQYFWRPSTYSGEAVMDMGLVGYFYEFNNMNLVMMLFGMVAIAWQYFKLILVFVKRALEMVLLFLMAPVVTAIAPLDKGNAENSWRSNWIKQLTMTAVPVFAINIFFTIVPLVSSLNMFANTNPLALTYNAFVSIIFIYVGVSMINRASALLAGFLGTEDMIVQGKDLTSKATGVVGTASKGAALVTGVALAGPAAAIKAGYSLAKGRKARNDSLLQSRKEALGDLNQQIAEARESGDDDRVKELQERKSKYEKYSKRGYGQLHDQYAKDQKASRDKINQYTAMNENDEVSLVRLRAKANDEVRRRFKEQQESYKLSDPDYEPISFDDIPEEQRNKLFQEEQTNGIYAQQIREKEKAIADRNSAIGNMTNSWAENASMYRNMMRSQDDAKTAGKAARSAAWKEANDGGTVKALEAGHKKLNNSMVGSAISHIPGLNWAVNKVAFGALGVGAQIADRKFFSGTPKNAMDFVKGVSGDAGKIAEKFMDPGTIGKVISTDDENKFRDTVKEEKARKKAWEEQMKFEDDKLKKQKKAQEELETKRQLREYERYKMGAYNVEGGKMTVNADKAETIAKHYDKTINSRADQDFKNNVQRDDKNFAKFKQMLKEMEDESKKKAQNVKIDPRDKGFGEQVINAMKTVNAQNNRELKNINSGIASLSKNIEDLVKKMSNNS